MAPGSIALRHSLRLVHTAPLPRLLKPSHPIFRRNSSSNSAPSHTNIYKTFGRPFAKVFLGALFVYQLSYWSWLKLAAMEEQREKDGEIKVLEGRVREIAGQMGNAKDSGKGSRECPHE